MSTGAACDDPRLADREKAAFRAHTLDSLRQVLKWYNRQLAEASTSEKTTIAGNLRRWQTCFDLEKLRGDQLKKLPPLEQSDWLWFWTEVELLRGQFGN